MMGPVAVALVVFLTVVTGATSYGLIASRSIERAEAQLAESRFDFLLSRTTEALERNLALGLPLQELERAPPLLEQVLARAPAVLAVDVLSAEGTTIYSTDRGAVGEQVPDDWLRAVAERRDDRWRAETPGNVTMGRPIRNDFDQVVGWAVVIVDRSALPAPFSLAPSILLKLVLPTLVFSLAGAVAAGFAYRRLTARDWQELGARFEGGDPIEPIDRANLAAKNATEDASLALANAQNRMERLDAKV